MASHAPPMREIRLSGQLAWPYDRFDGRSGSAKSETIVSGALFPQIFGKYVLDRLIAVGGMARVFLATLRGAGGFEKKLVVKQIRSELATDEAFVKRFVAEAKTTV